MLILPVDDAIMRDMVEAALYMFEHLYPLYVKLANEESEITSSAKFGRRHRVNTAISAYENVLGLVALPRMNITTFTMGMDVYDHKYKELNGFASEIEKLYKLYVDMISSRISVLNEFKKQVGTDAHMSAWIESRNIISNYNQQYAKLKNDTYYFANKYLGKRKG